MRTQLLHGFVIAVCVTALGLASVPAAHAGGPAGGFATELTQLMNYIELGESYQKQAEQVIQQAQMVEQMKQQLQNLPSSFLQQMHSGGGNILDTTQNDTNSMMSLISSLQAADADAGTISKTYQNAYNTLSTLHNEGIPANTAQYEAGMMELAKQKGSVYAKQASAFSEASADFQKQAAAVQSIANAAPNITSTVGGLQGIMQSNAVMSSQLTGIGNQLLAANALAARNGAENETKQCKQDAAASRAAASQVSINNAMAALAGGTINPVPTAPAPGSCTNPTTTQPATTGTSTL